MFSLPKPFKPTGARETWNINDGFTIDCSCFATPVRIVDGDISISGVTIDLTTLETRLDTIIDELELINAPVTQTMITTTVAGVIPSGCTSYAIVNLGITPADPQTPMNPMIINGISLSTKSVSLKNSTDSTKILSNAISYDPNGNTLLIVYNI